MFVVGGELFERGEGGGGGDWGGGNGEAEGVDCGEGGGVVVGVDADGVGEGEGGEGSEVVDYGFGDVGEVEGFLVEDLGRVFVSFVSGNGRGGMG